jgi:hypothetical protein
MIIQVDLGPMPPVVSLEEPEVTSQFHVRVVGGDDIRLVFAALVDAAAGRLEDGDAWITVDSVRRMARGRVGPGWDDALATMLDFARSRGWLDERGNAIKAHVEWPD